LPVLGVHRGRRSREVGLRGMPRSFRGLRPSMAVRALESSRWFMAGEVGLSDSDAIRVSVASAPVPVS